MENQVNTFLHGLSTGQQEQLSPTKGGTCYPENTGNRSPGFERSHYAGIKNKGFLLLLSLVLSGRIVC